MAGRQQVGVRQNFDETSFVKNLWHVAIQFSALFYARAVSLQLLNGFKVMLGEIYCKVVF